MKVTLPTCSTPSTQKEKASKKMKSSSEYSGQLRFPSSYVSAETFIAAVANEMISQTHSTTNSLRG